MSGVEFLRYAADLVRTAAGVDSLADLAAFRTATAAAKTAKLIAPDDTGALQRSIRVVRGKSGRVAVETNLYYAAFHEFGTSQMAPNPYMGPAVQKHAPDLVREVERARDRVVQEMS